MNISGIGGAYFIALDLASAERRARTVEQREAILAASSDCLHALGWQCYAFCQLDGTFDLVCDVPAQELESGLAKLTESLPLPATVGQILLLEPGEPLLRAVRHVLNAPVRMGLVRHAADWRWSSFLNMADPDRLGGMVDVPAVLGQLKGRGSPSLQRFARYIIEGEGAPEIAAEADADGLVGSRNWRARIRRSQSDDPATAARPRPRAADGEPAAPPRRRGRPPRQPDHNGPSLAEIAEGFPGDSHAAIRAAFATGRFTQREIGEHFDLRQGSVSRIVNLPQPKARKSAAAAAPQAEAATAAEPRRPGRPKRSAKPAAGSWPVVSPREAEEALLHGGAEDEEDMALDDLEIVDADEAAVEGEPPEDGSAGRARRRETGQKWWQKRAARRSASRRR